MLNAHCLRGVLLTPLIEGIMVKHALFEELEAFDPKYQTHYATLRDAARAAGAEALLNDYLRSAQGMEYARDVATAPDVASAIKAAQESADRLPYTLDNIGITREVAE